MKKNKNIRKTFLWSDMIVILAVILAGVAFLPFGLGWQELGYSIIVCGLCMAPLYMHGYKIVGESGVFQEECILVSRKDRESIFLFLSGESSSLDFHQQEQGGALVSLFYQKNKEVYYAQYFDYAQIMKGETFPVVKISSEQYEALRNLS